MSSDIEIARNANIKPINEIGSRLGIPDDAINPFGHYKAKISSNWLESQKNNKNGKLILVTAINPTPAGEGKTTTSVGLNDGLNSIGKKSIVCLREPSLGPCFGMKGGAAGGGYAQVVPMEDINLHFTGDFHAITSAHNLLSAIIDNHIYWGNKEGIDPRKVSWKRVLDMNDRALRQIVVSLGGVSNGFPRESGFDITVASEIMAILCLSENSDDLQKRLGNITIGYRRDKSPVFCKDINADGAMTVLLKEALQPNLVQTLENNPAFIHGGPFANIAHGCNSVIATRAGLRMGNYVVTEAGFGADLGAEKFFNIKCRKANLKPDAVVIVATIRALKMNGGLAKDKLSEECLDALRKGIPNLIRHIENIKKFGLPVVVAINHFVTDTDAEVEIIKESTSSQDTEAILCRHWADGSKGTKDLAEKVVEICDSGSANFKPLYNDDLSLIEKIKCIAKEIYRAEDISAEKKILDQLKEWENAGYGTLPVCMAKTQYSFSADPLILGAPENHKVPIREVRLSAGAGFIVAICGDIMTMPGLPRIPAAESIYIDKNNLVQGLFVAEGERICKEAVLNGWTPKFLVFNFEREKEEGINYLIKYCKEKKGITLAVSQKILSKISRKDNPQMIIGVFDQKFLDLRKIIDSKKSWVALDRVRDPGNLGTILRTCDATGAEGVILIGNCCDPFSPECTRASMGAIFSVKIINSQLDEFIKFTNLWNGKIVASSMNASKNYLETKWSNKSILLMGNEQSGLSEELEKISDQRIKLPMKGSSDSLNLSVATGILLYEMIKNKN